MWASGCTFIFECIRGSPRQLAVIKEGSWRSEVMRLKKILECYGEGTRLAYRAAVICLLAWSHCAGAEEIPQKWLLDVESSSLEFIFSQTGSEEQGEFKSFDAVFRFDPDNVRDSRFEVDIDVGSLDTGEPERDQILRSADMFDVEKWPQAHFKAFNIRERGDNRYLAEAELTIRDRTRSLDFPFKLDINPGDNTFRLKTELYIKRLDYGVGQDDWKATKWVADKVRIKIDVVAEKAK